MIITKLIRFFKRRPEAKAMPGLDFLHVLKMERDAIDYLRENDREQTMRKSDYLKDTPKTQTDVVDYFRNEIKCFTSGSEQSGNATPASPESKPVTTDELKRTKPQYSALCLSGGGIRSATFNLGVLQGLARYKRLRQFDYLSTVSGGGFIGSWYSAWLHRTKVNEANSRIDELGNNQKVVPKPDDPSPFITREAKPIRNLRQFSNYLSPELGILSADTWTLLSIYTRNMILTALVFLPFLMAVLALPRITFALMQSSPEALASGWVAPLTLVRFMLVVGIAAAVVGIAYVGLNLPAIRIVDWPRRYYVWGCLIPLLISTLSLSAVWSWFIRFEDIRRQLIRPNFSLSPPLLSTHWDFITLAVLLVMVSWLVALASGWRSGRIPLSTVFASTLLLMAGSAAGGALLAQITLHPVLTSAVMYTAFCVPVLLIIMMLCGTFMAGLTSRFTTDMDEEWWARSGAYLGIACFVWIIGHLLVLWLPGELLALANAAWRSPVQFVRQYGDVGRTAAAIIGVLSTVYSLWQGFSSNTAAHGERQRGGAGGNVLLNVAGTVALVFVLVVIAAGTNLLLVGIAPLVGKRITAPWTTHAVVLSESGVLLPLLVTFGLLGASIVFGYFIDTNKYSLHYFWKNRITRAYLRASRKEGASNPSQKIEDVTSVAFTDFDSADNLKMFQLQAQRPLHVINIALNLTGSKRLEWQERKAESFTVSPYHCGNYRIGYRPTKEYGDDAGGISLATAVAISGAAVSPNMGYMMTSPVIRLLMTLFNIRLGWWLGNPGEPGQQTFTRRAPRYILRPLLSEAFGQTDETSPYVYLSDGGHFENLGMYEMVLRRCRFIMVCDASTDPQYEYESLAQAIRKIRIDLGIPIVFTSWGNVGSAEGGPTAHWAVARILYSRADPPNEDQLKEDFEGDLLYVKPSLIGGEPRDILNYARQNPSFPQEPISDQFFAESQFESYRELGDHIVSELSGHKDGVLKDLLNVARNELRPPVLGEKIVDELKELRRAVAGANG